MSDSRRVDGSAPARSTVVLVPGLLCDQDIWRDQALALGRDHEVLCPGFMDHPSIAAMAEDILDRAPAQFSLAGHSMGGRVALEVVRRAPERVTRLALLDTGHHPAKAGEAASRAALLRLAREEGMAALARRWLPPMVAAGRAADGALMARLTAMVERASPDLFERQVQALLGRPNAYRGLGAIPCPTALIVGRLDTWSPPAQHEDMTARIPGAYLTVIDGSGHMSPVEQPVAVNAALSSWMRTAGPRQSLAEAS
jgi:pimeloyl-ACP methyl ester carboxylesterase